MEEWTNQTMNIPHRSDFLLFHQIFQISCIYRALFVSFLFFFYCALRGLHVTHRLSANRIGPCGRGQETGELPLESRLSVRRIWSTTEAAGDRSVLHKFGGNCDKVPSCKSVSLRDLEKNKGHSVETK